MVEVITGLVLIWLLERVLLDGIKLFDVIKGLFTRLYYQSILMNSLKNHNAYKKDDGCCAKGCDMPSDNKVGFDLGIHPDGAEKPQEAHV